MNIDRLLHHQQDSAVTPPVDQWHPALSGDIDILIRADGSWLHDGEPFARPAVARLLASLLRRDPEGVCLVTPTERWRVQVEDCPLLIVEADFLEQAWWLTTQFGDRLRLDLSHPLTLSSTPEGECLPEVAVRFGLAARLHRNVYYRLVDEATLESSSSGSRLMLQSAGHAFVLGELPADDDSPSEVS